MTFSKGTKSVKLALKSKGGEDLNEQAIAEWAGNYMDFTPYQDDTHHFVSYLPLAPHVTISGESMMSAFFAQSIGGPNNVVYTGGVVFASGDYSANGMIPTDALFKKQKCMNLPLVVVAKYTIKEMVEIQ